MLGCKILQGLTILLLSTDRKQLQGKGIIGTVRVVLRRTRVKVTVASQET